MLWASHVLLWAQQMCLLETWLATRQPAKALPQISWPLSFQKAHYPMSWHASKVTNAYYYWRSFVFPFKFTAHSQNTLLSICSLLGFLYRSILCLILFELHFRHHQKLPPLTSTFFQKTTSVGCSKAHTDIYDTSFLSYSMPFFFFFHPWSQRTFFDSLLLLLIWLGRSRRIKTPHTHVFFNRTFDFTFLGYT